MPGWNDLEIVLLGVGGAPSSGKTVLIDSLFRFMGAYRPGYLEKSNLIDPKRLELQEVDAVFENNPLRNHYRDINSLNSWVTDFFHRQGIPNWVGKPVSKPT